MDAMGGDSGPEVTIPGAVNAAKQDNLGLILTGNQEQIEQALNKEKIHNLEIDIRDAPEVVGMQEKPSEGLRRKRNSSIQAAFKTVREKKAHGVVSAGNSGATLGCGMFTLGRVKGIERPALASILPTEKKEPLVLVDVGANIECKPYHLVQFGLMADVFARNVLHISKPRVGVLTIGEEEGKGNKLVMDAIKLFKMSSMNFIGNVEGRDFFSGKADVVVCDGFVGNIALKLMEGLAISLSNTLKAEVKKSLLAKLGFLLSTGALRKFGRHIDYAEYGGAPLLGLKGISLVCHGSSNAKAITNAVLMAGEFVRNQANEHLVQGLEENQEIGLFKKTPQPKDQVL